MTDPHPRRRYPSDLTERQWSRVEPLLPELSRMGRPRGHALRNVLDAINYRWETGCVWRMLPHDFPPWGTVYTYFRTWQRSGVLRLVRDSLIGRQRGKRTPRSHAAQSAAAWPTNDRCDPDSPQSSESTPTASEQTECSATSAFALPATGTEVS